MKDVLKLLRLHLMLALRKWQLGHAREFRAGLETTIARERVRAQRGVEYAELMERRAEMAIIAARADKRIPANTATETR